MFTGEDEDGDDDEGVDEGSVVACEVDGVELEDDVLDRYIRFITTLNPPFLTADEDGDGATKIPLKESGKDPSFSLKDSWKLLVLDKMSLCGIFARGPPLAAVERE